MNKIEYETRKRIYYDALDTWGEQVQLMKAVEEMSELTKEICKLSLNATTLDKLADEIADVTIMLEQLRLIFDINGLVCAHMDTKVKRLEQRVFEAREATA